MAKIHFLTCPSCGKQYQIYPDQLSSSHTCETEEFSDVFEITNKYFSHEKQNQGIIKKSLEHQIDYNKLLDRGIKEEK